MFETALRRKRTCKYCGDPVSMQSKCTHDENEEDEKLLRALLAYEDPQQHNKTVDVCSSISNNITYDMNGNNMYDYIESNGGGNVAGGGVGSLYAETNRKAYNQNFDEFVSEFYRGAINTNLEHSHKGDKNGNVNNDIFNINYGMEKHRDNSNKNYVFNATTAAETKCDGGNGNNEGNQNQSRKKANYLQDHSTTKTVKKTKTGGRTVRKNPTRRRTAKKNTKTLNKAISKQLLKNVTKNVAKTVAKRVVKTAGKNAAKSIANWENTNLNLTSKDFRFLSSSPKCCNNNTNNKINKYYKKNNKNSNVIYESFGRNYDGYCIDNLFNDNIAKNIGISKNNTKTSNIRKNKYNNFKDDDIYESPSDISAFFLRQKYINGFMEYYEKCAIDRPALALNETLLCAAIEYACDDDDISNIEEARKILSNKKKKINTRATNKVVEALVKAASKTKKKTVPKRKTAKATRTKRITRKFAKTIPRK